MHTLLFARAPNFVGRTLLRMTKAGGGGRLSRIEPVEDRYARS